MRRLGPPTLLVSLLALAAACDAHGQEADVEIERADDDRPASPPGAAAESEAAEDEAAVREAQPPLHLLDENDVLVPVPGIRWEDFERMLREHAGERRRRPRYSLQSLRIGGVVEGDRATLTAEIDVLLNVDDWVSVPLRFGEAVLEKALVDGPAKDHFTIYDEGAGGYVSWIRAEAGITRRITMNLEAAIDRTAAESRLVLSTPRATVSQLDLRVPLAKAACRLTGEGLTEEPRPEPDGGTTLSVRRLDGPLELAWWDAARPMAEESPDLEATATVAARVDGRTIRTTATLTVRSFAGEFDRFLVRLPPGASPTPVAALGFQIVEPPFQPPDPSRRMVEVRLDSKTAGPVAVRLEVERPFHFDDPEPLELGGFEVEGAVRQSGYLAVQVVGDWRVDFEPLEATVRRVETVPEALRREDSAAAFEFLRQPFSLRANVAPRETRLHVDPEYVYLVGAAEVRLDARLRYTVRGAKAFELRIDLPGWEVEEIGPASLLKVDEIERNLVTPLTIPLAKATTGQFELTLRARRASPPGENDLTIALPSPRADTFSPAAVVVLPDDNVELRPKADAMPGLNRQRVVPTMNLPVRQQEPLFYRADEPAASFAAESIVHEPSLGVDLASEATWDEQQSRVEQRFSYRAEYEPVEALLLDFPASIVDEPDLEVLLDGAALPLREAAGESTVEGRVLRQVELPVARIGKFDLVVRYRLPPREVRADEETPWTVPLILPADGTLGANELRVRATGGAIVAARSGEWKSTTAENGGAAVGGELQLTAAAPLPQVELTLMAGQRSVEGNATVIDRAWIQSWLTADGRQDRAAFRFFTDRTWIAVTLPQGVVASGLTVQLDGRAVALEGTPRRTLEIAIPAGRPERAHTLELQYRFAARDPRNGVLAIAAPQFPDDAWLQRLYWEVALPPDEHVLQAPSDFAGEHRWVFRGFGWRREPLRDQRQLEEWIGVGSRSELPAAANVYLYSALSARPALELRTASRALLVFAASLAALSAGLVVMYAPPRGRRLAAFSAVGAAAALAAAYPEASLLLMQAAALGLALAALAMLLDRLLSRRPRRPLVRRAPSSIVERRSTDALARPQLVAAPASTMTAAVESQGASPDDSP